MGKIMVVGDLHFKANNLVEGRALVSALSKAAYAINPSVIVFLGDILDNHATIHSQAFNLIYTLLKSLPSNSIIIMLIGNHDYINNSQCCSEEHPFNVFKQWKNVMVIDRPTIIDDYIYMPYVPVGKFDEFAKGKIQDYKGIKAIFCHQEFLGSVKENVGDVWPETNPLIISGHIHTKRWLQSNIFYPGSPIQHTFAEDPDKTFLIMDSNDLQMEFRTLDLPKKHTLEIDLDSIETLALPDGHIRLKVRCSYTGWAAFRKTKKYKELTASKVKVIPVAITDDTHLKTMAKKRVTYIDSLTEYANQAGGFVLEAFKEIMIP